MVYGRDLDFDDEDDLKDWLKKKLENNGWKVRREISPKGSQVRADLLIKHEKIGWIGIEAKYLTSLRNGKKIGEALDQILYKYRGEDYLTAGEIDLWAVSPYVENINQTGIKQSIREILCHFGIAILWPHHPDLMIDFAYSDRDTKIMGTDPLDDHYGDIERIREMVDKKISLDGGPVGVCQRNTDGYGCTAPAFETVTTGKYEIKLCKHHLREYDQNSWKQIKSTRNGKNGV